MAAMTQLPLYPGALTDITGLTVGHAAAAGRPTGCTVVLCPDGVTVALDVRGGAPGTRETDLLRAKTPSNACTRCCSPAAAPSGWMRRLVSCAGWTKTATDWQVGPAHVPIVPAAVLFDLWVGDARIRPGADTGYAACQAARSDPPAQGNAGAWRWCAPVGKLFGIERAMKGGIGTASLQLGAFTVAALVAVNAIGDVLDADPAR
jgi:L-aminopeptidase/D-esterase-like protein